MRDLTPQTEAAINEVVTQPRYLIEIHFSQVIRLSTGEQTAWLGNLYTAAGANVEQMNIGESAVVSLPNADFIYSAVMLREGSRDKNIKIWIAYSDAPTELSPVLLFDGFIDSTKVGIRATLFCSAESSFLISPRIVGSAPLMNHIPPEGTKIGNFIIGGK